MNLVQTLYPYVLAAINTGIGWLSYTFLNLDFGVLFMIIGLLVFFAVVGRSVLRVNVLDL